MSDERKDPKAEDEREPGSGSGEDVAAEGSEAAREDGDAEDSLPAEDAGEDAEPAEPEVAETEAAETRTEADGSRESEDAAAEDTGDEAGEPDIEILGYEALTDAGVSLGGPEEAEAGDEHDIDLSDFDAPVEDTSELESELGAARDQAEELRREKAEAEQELASVRDQLRRTAADFENYRKRIERDRREERKQAAASLVLKLLPVTDNFRRALDQASESAREHEVLAGFVEGVRLIETQFFDILRGAGLEPVSAEGTFDPAVHEALMQEPTTEAPHLSILEVFEPGYLFGGRLLRPARVKVAQNPEGAVEPESVEESPPDPEAEPDRDSSQDAE